jgi:hypothetical protein
MKIRLWLIMATQAILVVLLTAAIASRMMPLGIPSEWEWLRVHASPPIAWLGEAALSVAGYSVFIAIGFRALSGARASSRVREAFWVAQLLIASITVQVLIPTGAADEYDLTKWAYVNYLGASSGYYKVARQQAVADPWTFLARYPVWIQSQDSLHIGTHPPGLIALQCLLIRTMEQSPRGADRLLRLMPYSTAEGFRQLEQIDRRQIPRADRAALYLASLLTLLSCAGTVVPLYLLVRSALPAPAAWTAAALWPLAPSANLFQPDADAAYPFLSTSALALAAWAACLASEDPRPGRGLVLASICGLVLAVGIFFTLAFLPVGLIVGIVILTAGAVSTRRRAKLVLAVGLGFLAITVLGWALTRANPITIWTWNLRNHARFYVEYPRTYLAWVILNPIELAVALGLPSMVWCVAGFLSPRSVPRSGWATLGVLLLLNVIGRNMGEVARLWLVFMPLLLTAAGAGLARLGGGAWSLGFSAALLGLQTLALQTMIQVVYPV